MKTCLYYQLLCTVIRLIKVGFHVMVKWFSVFNKMENSVFRCTFLYIPPDWHCFRIWIYVVSLSAFRALTHALIVSHTQISISPIKQPIQEILMTICMNRNQTILLTKNNKFWVRDKNNNFRFFYSSSFTSFVALVQTFIVIMNVQK